MTINWDNLHLDSRREICSGAAVNIEVAQMPWSDIDLWLQLLLSDSISRRTYNRVVLAAYRHAA